MRSSLPAPLELHPDLAELPALLAYIDHFAVAHGLSGVDAHAIALVAEELFANSVHHGNSEPGAASVRFGLSLAGQTLTVAYSDAGRPFDPTTADIRGVPQSSVPAEERPIGGLGIHLMRKLMQNVKYARKGRRNILTLERRLGADRLAQNQP